MAGEEQWEYRHSWFSVRLKEGGSDRANAVMKEWTAAGWELYSATASPFVSVQGGGGGHSPGITRFDIESSSWIFYSMFWRKRVSSGAAA
jgi:hypothetical protein